MPHKELLDACLPYLRLLTNPIIDVEVAVLLLADAPMEIIYGLQAILYIGLFCIAKDIDGVSADPLKCFAAIRDHFHTDSEDSIIDRIFLIQSNYVEFLTRGMEFLQLS